MAHAKFSPSAAHRWLRCPGSLILEDYCPDGDTSAYAEEGTAAHALAETCLRHGKQASDFIGELFNDHEVDSEMAGYVQQFVDYVRHYANLENAKLFVEQTVDFSEYVGVENQFGTVDAVVVTPDELIIIDLKYGKGIPVSAEGNEQLMIYALGAYEQFGMLSEVEKVRLVIHQPRIYDAPSEWDTTIEDLEYFGVASVRMAADKYSSHSDGGDMTDALEPGEKQCRFCPAKAICPALKQTVIDELVGDSEFNEQNVYDSLQYYNSEDVEAEELSKVLGMVDLVEMWCRGVRDTAQARAERGYSIPGYKLAEGKKGARKWKDKDKAEEVMRKHKLRVSDIYKRDLISPTQAEKMLKKKDPKTLEELQEFVEQPSGKPVLVPEEDDRPALDEQNALEFEKLS